MAAKIPQTKTVGTPPPVSAKRPAVTRSAAAKKSAAGDSAATSKKLPKPKARLVRDSFTMPQEDHALIAALKSRALKFKRPTKKSELLRAGLHALQALPADALRQALDGLTPLKVGRPRRDES